MTNDEIKGMLERQLVRLEKMSETTTHPRALTGMTGSMLAVSRQLEQMHMTEDEAKKTYSDLLDFRQSVIEFTKIIEDRFGREDPLHQQARRIAGNISSIIFKDIIRGTDGGNA